jgi:integrase
MLVMRAVTDPKNAVDDRPKNFLTEAEVENFLKAGRKGHDNVRNFAMLLLAFRHGLRVSELINIRTANVDLDNGRLFVRRLDPAANKRAVNDCLLRRSVHFSQGVEFSRAGR